MNQFQCRCGHTRPLHHCVLLNWGKLNYFVFSNYLFKGRIEVAWQFYSWIAPGQGIWGSQWTESEDDCWVKHRGSWMWSQEIWEIMQAKVQARYSCWPQDCHSTSKNKMLIKWLQIQLSERLHVNSKHDNCIIKRTCHTAFFLCNCSAHLGIALYPGSIPSQPFDLIGLTIKSLFKLSGIMMPWKKAVYDLIVRLGERMADIYPVVGDTKR